MAKDLEKGSMVSALVLTDCGYGKCLDVVTLSAEAAQQGIDAGVLDTNPAAVAVGTVRAPVEAE